MAGRVKKVSSLASSRSFKRKRKCREGYFKETPEKRYFVGRSMNLIESHVSEQPKADATPLIIGDETDIFIRKDAGVVVESSSSYTPEPASGESDSKHPRANSEENARSPKGDENSDIHELDSYNSPLGSLIKPQDLPSNENSDFDEGNENFQLSYDYAKSVIRKSIARVISSVKKLKSVSEQLSHLRHLSEKLSFALAYAMIGNKILGKSEVKELSAILVRIIDTYAYVDKPGPSKRSRNNTHQKLDSQTESAADAHKSSELIVIACNCLALIVEDSCDDAKIVVRSGVIRALVRRLNGQDHEIFAEHIISLIYKISFEYPSSLTSRELISAIMKNISLLDIHMQRTAMETLSNILSALTSDVKRGSNDASPQDSDFCDLHDLMNAVSSYLFSPDNKVVEHAISCIARITELSMRRSITVDSLFSTDTIKKLVDLMAVSVGLIDSDNLKYTELLGTNNQNPNCRAGLLVSQSLSYLIKTVIFIVQSSANNRFGIMKDLRVLDVILYFFTRSTSEAPAIPQLDLKSHIIRILITADDSKTFDMLYLLANLISFQPTAQNLLDVLGDKTCRMGQESLPGSEPEDTIIANEIVRSENLIPALVELLDSNYNFYLTYEVMDILTKVIWCSSDLSGLSKLLTSTEIIAKIMRSCFDIGVYYYSSSGKGSVIVEQDFIADGDPVHRPHYAHARTLFEYGLKFVHLLIVRFGDAALNNLERSEIDNYFLHAVETLKRYYGTVEYSLRSRRKIMDQYAGKCMARRNPGLHITEGCFGSDRDPRCSSCDSCNSFGKVNIGYDHPFRRLSSSSRLDGIIELIPTVSISELCPEEHVSPSNTAIPRKRQLLASDIIEKKVGIALDDDTSDDINRAVFGLCELILSQMSEFRDRADSGRAASAIQLASKDLKNADNIRDDPLNMGGLKKMAEIFAGITNVPPTAAECLRYEIFCNILLYLKDKCTNYTQPGYEHNLEDNTDSISNMKLEAFLHVFTGSPNPVDNSNSFYVPGALGTLLALLNSSLGLLGLFPHLGSNEISIFSVPLKANKLLRFYTEKAPDSLKRVFFPPRIPSHSEYFVGQLEKRILLKLVPIGPNETLQSLSGTNLSAHCLSNFLSLQSYICNRISERNQLLNDIQKIGKLETSDSNNPQFESYVFKLHDKDIKTPLAIYDRSSSSSSRELSDYDVNDNSTESDAINFLTREGRDDGAFDIVYMPQNDRQLFGISDPENHTSPVTVNLTDIIFSSILNPHIKTSPASCAIPSSYAVEEIMGGFACLLPEIARRRSRYSLRNRKRPNVSDPGASDICFPLSSTRSNAHSPQSVHSDEKFDISLRVGKTPVAVHDSVSKKLYDSYISPYNRTVRSLYNRFYEIAVAYDASTGIAHENLADGSFDSQQLCSSGRKISSFSPPAKDILQLLKLLFDHRSSWADITSNSKNDVNMLFINPTITARILRQLGDPITAFSRILPAQCHELLTEYKFIFPLKLRRFYFHIMSLHGPKVTCIWKEQTLSNFKLVDDDSRHANRLRRMGNVPRMKIKINRFDILETAMHIFFEFGPSESELTIEYNDEVGAGLGPTLEFYTNLCIEIQKVSYSDKNSTAMFPLWRNDPSSDDEFVFSETGLFPAPIPPFRKKSMCAAKAYAKMLYNTLRVFSLIGTFVAKSIADSRLIDIPLCRVFIEMAFLGKRYNSMLDGIRLIEGIDPVFYRSLKSLMKYVEAKNSVMNSNIPNHQKELSISQIKFDNLSVEDLCLDFTYPGYPGFELVHNGSNTLVTIKNIDKYIEYLVDYTVGSGIDKQLSMFRRGFNSVIPVDVMKCFHADEITDIVSDTSRGLSFEDIISNIKTDHGYTTSSPTVINFAKVVSSFAPSQLRIFIQFITGSTRLPISGLKGLVPPLTIVRRLEDSSNPNDHLPSVMTCVNYLKLPDYTDIDILRSKLLYSINEGLNSFHLS